MNRKQTITVALLTVLCFSVLGQVFAQLRTPAVLGGDTFTYKITSRWTSDNATEPIPSWLTDYNETKQYLVRIGDVSGINVTSTHIWDFKNGTTTPYFITIDVESGTPYYLSGSQPPFEGIVGGNLRVGELLHPAGNDNVTINQTLSRSYVGGIRDTNLVDLNGPVQNATTNPLTNQTTYVTIGNQDVKFYLDKATGMLVERDVTLESFNPHETATVTWTLTQTNRWDATLSSQQSSLLSMPILIAIAAVVIIVVIIVIVFVFRRKNRPKRLRR